MTYHVSWIRDLFTREVLVYFYKDGKQIKSKLFIFDYGTKLEDIHAYLKKYCAGS